MVATSSAANIGCPRWPWSWWLCTPGISGTTASSEVVVDFEKTDRAVKDLVGSASRFPQGFRRSSPRPSRAMVLQPFSFKLLTGDLQDVDEQTFAVASEDHGSSARAAPFRDMEGPLPSLAVLEQRLQLAVWDGDTHAVRGLLQEHPSLVAPVLADDADSSMNPGSQAALGLAIRLRRLEIVLCLLEAGADLLAGDGDGWRLEAHLPRAFPDDDALLAQASEAVGRRRWIDWQERASDLAERLNGIPDCEIALTWAFSTWVPVVGHLLPQDTVCVRKLGARLRIDYTLKSVSGFTWEYGNCSVLACPDKDGAVHFLDHDVRKIDTLERKLLRTHSTEQERAKRQRRRPLKRGFLNAASLKMKESTERSACGAFQNCKTYKLDGLEYTTLVLPRLPGTRVEDGSSSRWKSLLNFAKSYKTRGAGNQTVDASADVLQFEAVFPNCELADHSPTAEALPPSSVHQVRQISANVLMSKDFPLSREQFVVIAEALSASDERYLTIKDFFETSLPDGFPVQFTLPVVPALSAVVSFTKARLVASDPKIFELPCEYAEAMPSAASVASARSVPEVARKPKWRG